MDSDSEKNIADRVAAAKFLRDALNSNRPFDTAWLEFAIDAVEVGRMKPSEAMHGFYRYLTRQQIVTLSTSENVLLKGMDEILRCGGFPPRPRQCRVGIKAARQGGIVTLFGPSGTGKTTCAVRAAAMIAAAETFPLTIIAVGGARIGRMRTSELYELVEAALSADIVILDDIDKGSKSDTRSSAILEILDARERDFERHTIVTSNKAGGELAEQIESQTAGYGMPIVNRLRRGITVDFEPEEFDARAAEYAIRNKLVARCSDPDERESVAEFFGRLDWRRLL